jgi:hypothetical protein
MPSPILSKYSKFKTFTPFTGTVLAGIVSSSFCSSSLSPVSGSSLRRSPSLDEAEEVKREWVGKWSREDRLLKGGIVDWLR